MLHSFAGQFSRRGHAGNSLSPRVRNFTFISAGLIIEPGKKYSQTVDSSFHISKATLDTSNATGKSLFFLYILLWAHHFSLQMKTYLSCWIMRGNKSTSCATLTKPISKKASISTSRWVTAFPSSHMGKHQFICQGKVL